MRIWNKGWGEKVELSQYHLKVYNKGLQSDLSENILRFEKKVNKMENIRKEPIYLSDLLEISLAEHCFNQLLECFENLIVTENIKLSLMTEQQQKIYNNGNNPRNWKVMTSKQRCNCKSRFTTIIDTLGTQRLKLRVYTALKNKGSALLFC